MNKTCFTNVIILRKTRYRESSLIVTGLSPKYGRIDLILKGALQLKKNKFPIIDLFREIKIAYSPEKENLQTVYKPELVAQADNIANYPDTFLKLMTLASFISNNTENMVDSTLLYTALQTTLRHCAINDIPQFPWTLATKIVYLYENGLLPSYDDKPKEKAFIYAILKTALQDTPPPEATSSYWESLENWVDELCKYHKLSLPKT